MPIPKFIDGYHLPPGEHVCTFEEIKARFGTGCEQRQKVWNAFARCYDRIEELRLNPKVVLVDGSFVTGREYPNDVDAAILLRIEEIAEALEVADHEDKKAILLFARTANANDGTQELIRYLFGTHVIFAFDEVMLATLSSIFRMGICGRLREPDPNRDPVWVKRPSEKGILKVYI